MVIATPASQLFATSPVVKIAVFFLFTTYSIEIVAYSERLSTTLKIVSPGLGGGHWDLLGNRRRKSSLALVAKYSRLQCFARGRSTQRHVTPSFAPQILSTKRFINSDHYLTLVDATDWTTGRASRSNLSRGYQRKRLRWLGAAG
jgi:hypothetical protein